jgi:hypothetical protein
LKRILIPIFFALAFCPISTKADDGGYLGTVLENGAANYVVQMDDGSLLDPNTGNPLMQIYSTGDFLGIKPDPGVKDPKTFALYDPDRGGSIERE